MFDRVVICEISNMSSFERFTDVSKMIKMREGTEKFLDYSLTCYAYYLVAQNNDFRKEVIVPSQAYFAL